MSRKGWPSSAHHPHWNISNYDVKKCKQCNRGSCTPLRCQTCSNEACERYCYIDDPSFRDQVDNGCWNCHQMAFNQNQRDQMWLQHDSYLASLGREREPDRPGETRPINVQAAPAGTEEARLITADRGGQPQLAISTLPTSAGMLGPNLFDRARAQRVVEPAISENETNEGIKEDADEERPSKRPKTQEEPSTTGVANTGAVAQAAAGFASSMVTSGSTTIPNTPVVTPAQSFQPTKEGGQFNSPRLVAAARILEGMRDGPAANTTSTSTSFDPCNMAFTQGSTFAPPQASTRRAFTSDNQAISTTNSQDPGPATNVAPSAASRLGIDEAEVETWRLARAESAGGDTIPKTPLASFSGGGTGMSGPLCEHRSISLDPPYILDTMPYARSATSQAEDDPDGSRDSGDDDGDDDEAVPDSQA